MIDEFKALFTRLFMYFISCYHILIIKVNEFLLSNNCNSFFAKQIAWYVVIVTSLWWNKWTKILFNKWNRISCEHFEIRIVQKVHLFHVMTQSKPIFFFLTNEFSENLLLFLLLSDDRSKNWVNNIRKIEFSPEINRKL